MIKAMTTAFALAAVLCGTANAQETTGQTAGGQAVPELTTFTQANDAFSKTGDPAAKTAIYETAKALAAKSDRSFQDSLISLRRMALVVGKGDDFADYCLSFSDISNKARAEAAVAALADFHSAAGNPAAAVSVLTDFLKRRQDLDAAQFASVSIRAASILHTKLNDSAGAAEMTAKVLALGRDCPGTHYVAAAEMLASVRKTSGDFDGAFGALMLIPEHPDAAFAGIARKMIDTGADAESLSKAIAALRGRMAVPQLCPAFGRTIYRRGNRIMNWYLHT